MVLFDKFTFFGIVFFLLPFFVLDILIFLLLLFILLLYIWIFILLLLELLFFKLLPLFLLVKVKLSSVWLSLSIFGFNNEPLKFSNSFLILFKSLILISAKLYLDLNSFISFFILSIVSFCSFIIFWFSAMTSPVKDSSKDPPHFEHKDSWITFKFWFFLFASFKFFLSFSIVSFNSSISSVLFIIMELFSSKIASYFLFNLSNWYNLSW